MEQLATERKLTISYVLCVIFGATTSITSGIAWGHWYLTLDQCIGRNCSCILYGKDTPTKFLGGDQAPCIWVTFGPLIYVFFCLCLTCFHGYRVLFTSKSPRTRTTRTTTAKMGPGESVQIHTISQEDTSPLPKCFWICTSIFTTFFFIYSLVHFSIFIDGYYRTCNQFRNYLEKLLGLHGSAIPVIHGRLYCQGIYDFMDYMLLDSENAFRSGFINTGLDLIIGVVTAGLSCLSFLVGCILNIKMARAKDD